MASLGSGLVNALKASVKREFCDETKYILQKAECFIVRRRIAEKPYLHTSTKPTQAIKAKLS